MLPYMECICAMYMLPYMECVCAMYTLPYMEYKLHFRSGGCTCVLCSI